MRRRKPFTIYLDDVEKSRLHVVAESQDHFPSRIARRFVLDGIRRWDRKQQDRLRDAAADRRGRDKLR